MNNSSTSPDLSLYNPVSVRPRPIELNTGIVRSVGITFTLTAKNLKGPDGNGIAFNSKLRLRLGKRLSSGGATE